MSPAGQPTQNPPAATQSCASCGAPLAPDQRYCLSCGSRVGEPRVAPAAGKAAEPVVPATAPAGGRQADFSPLAAVIGIALLGGMLLIGVLIGRGTSDDQPAPVVQVGEATSSTTTPGDGAQATAPGDSGSGAITSEWPAGTDGFTIQLSTIAKSDATPESVSAAEQSAVSDGAADAAVLDSDQFSSLPPGNYVIYSGVYTDRKSAEVALKGLTKSFPSATVVEVAGASSDAEGSDAATVPGAGGENELTPPETNK